jgi:hypothetical protein
LKHDQIVTISTHYPAYKNNKIFRTNFTFVRDIYNEVAKEYGIKLPKTWVTASKFTKRETRVKSNRWLMEPLGPVIYVDDAYNPLQYFYSISANGSVLHTANWHEQARSFFMVDIKTEDVVKGNKFTPTLLCESWRAKSFYLIFK